MSTSYGRILSVDNEPAFRLEINRYLEDSGFTTYEANSGLEAISLFRREKPDVVITNLEIPGENGLDLLDTIHNESPDTPIIVVSKTSALDSIVEALHLGAWDYVIQPVKNLAVLEHVVCRVLERSRLVLDNKRYRKELEEKNSQLTRSLTQLKEDQKAGRSVQQQLLPKQEIQFDHYHFYHKVLPSLYLSGDFVDYFRVNEGHIAFYMIDVSGHGASSAFITVMIKSLIEQLFMSYQAGQDETILSPNKVLKCVSNSILQAKLGKYLTMIYGVIDQIRNKLYYSVGGHYPNPILMTERQAQFLPGSGFAVGVYQQAEYKTEECQLPTDCSLYLMSDGIFEVMEGKNSQEKEQKLLHVIEKSGPDIKSFLDKIGAKRDHGFPDDISIVMMKHH